MDIANEVSTVRLTASYTMANEVSTMRLTASYTMLTVTSCHSECYVPSGLDFEAAGDSGVRYFVSNYLLQELRVVNMTWALFPG